MKSLQGKLKEKLGCASVAEAVSNFLSITSRLPRGVLNWPFKVLYVIMKAGCSPERFMVNPSLQEFANLAVKFGVIPTLIRTRRVCLHHGKEVPDGSDKI